MTESGGASATLLSREVEGIGRTPDDFTLAIFRGQDNLG
jgi:hypothetical protein